MTKRKPSAEGKGKATAAPRVPASVATPRAAARTSAAKAAIPEASGLPERFTFKQRGASIEVVDNETGRRTPFPKDGTGIVVKVLSGLFSEVAEEKPEPGAARAKPAGLPPAHANAEMGLVMRRCTVAVDPSHPNEVLGSPRKHPKGYVVNAYEIEVDGEVAGHLIAHPNGRFTLAKGDGRLVEKHSHHTSFDNGVLRVEYVVPAYRARKAAKAAAGEQPLVALSA